MTNKKNSIMKMRRTGKWNPVQQNMDAEETQAQESSD